MTTRAPDVRYVTTTDGVQIACWSIGEGPPVVITHNLSLSNATMEWRVPTLWRFFTGLAETHTVVRYDPRMAGVSAHEAPSMTMGAMCLDIDAVANGLGLESFALIGISIMGPVVAEYAATRPDRVDSLIFCDPVINVAQSQMAEALRGSLALTESTSAEFAMGILTPAWTEPEEAEELQAISTAQYSRDSSVIVEAELGWDATSLVADVRAPTLVVQADEALFGDPQQARQIAVSIQGTRLVTVPGKRAPYATDGGAALAAIREHLGGLAGGFVPRPGLKAVVFTDIVDSTAYTNKVGDETARKEVRMIESLIADEASSHDGRVVKHLGDGSMLVFETPQAAVDFALTVQTGMSDQHLDLRIGMAVGDPVEEARDLHGAVVNLASRVAAEAPPGAVVVSDGTKQLLVGKPFSFTHIGRREVKGFDDPIQVYEVTARD